LAPFSSLRITLHNRTQLARVELVRLVPDRLILLLLLGGIALHGLLATLGSDGINPI
jgi:hypothetical protein